MESHALKLLMRILLFSILSFSILVTGVSEIGTPQEKQSSNSASAELNFFRNETEIMLVVGAPGEEQYGELFLEWSRYWVDAVEHSPVNLSLIGPGYGQNASKEDELSDHDRFEKILKNTLTGNPEELWLILIGHGTYDGKTAKFNLIGSDVSSVELSEWLGDYKGQLIIVCNSSSSAPFLKALTGPGRILITATKSGYEQNFSRFGSYFSEGLFNRSADVDKDGQVSLLEAFLTASRQTQQFYKQEGRLATEHALIDDNGDGFGTPVDWFKGTRSEKTPKGGSSADGYDAHHVYIIINEIERWISGALKDRREEIETEIETLRQKKEEMSLDDYYNELEDLMIRFAELYKDIDLSVGELKKNAIAL